MTCSSELQTILGLVRFVLNLIRFAIPILLIVLLTIDLAKIVTAGNLDDKLKKEVMGKVTSRIIYAVIIFLVPTIVMLLFSWLPDNVTGYNDNQVSWSDCFNGKVK